MTPLYLWILYVILLEGVFVLLLIYNREELLKSSLSGKIVYIIALKVLSVMIASVIIIVLMMIAIVLMAIGIKELLWILGIIGFIIINILIGLGILSLYNQKKRRCKK